MLIPGAIKTKKSQCAESQRNKTVLSTVAAQTRLGKCLAVAVQRADCSTAVVRGPQNFYRRALTVFGDCTCVDIS